MNMLKKCVKWYIKAFGNAYGGDSYRYYRL